MSAWIAGVRKAVPASLVDGELLDAEVSKWGIRFFRREGGSNVLCELSWKDAFAVAKAGSYQIVGQICEFPRILPVEEPEDKPTDPWEK